MRVKVVRRAFYRGQMRRVGEVLELEDGASLRHWMVRVSDTTPIRHLGAQGALNQEMVDRYGEVPTARPEEPNNAALVDDDPLAKPW